MLFKLPGRFSRVSLAASLGLVIAVLGLTGVSGLTPATAQEEPAGTEAEAGAARSAIFMMGDGMGAAQRDAIQLATVGAYDRLVMDSLPYEGMVGTNSVDPETFVTDSAAGATSFASGIKTVNGAVGVDPEGTAVPTVLEQAKAAGKSVGLVTTSQVTDASPAAFASHVEDRDNQTEIARQYIYDSQPDVILGGGEDYWYPEGNEGAYPDDSEAEETSQSDQGNLVDQAQQQGYQYVTSADELAAASGPKVLGLFANETMFTAEPEPEGVYEPTVPLTQMTQKAIDILSQNPNGFFLFVEEEATDEMGHANNGGLQIKSGQALNDAVSLGKSYADQSGDTLLMTTADHECCGLSVEQTDDPEYPDENGGNQGSENANQSTEDGPFPVVDSDYQFIMDWTTTSHTAVDVPLTATGPGAAALTGNYENTHIYDVMATSLGVAGIAPLTGAATMPETGGPGAEMLQNRNALLLAAVGLLGGGLLILAVRRRKSGA